MTQEDADRMVDKCMHTAPGSYPADMVPLVYPYAANLSDQYRTAISKMVEEMQRIAGDDSQVTTRIRWFTLQEDLLRTVKKLETIHAMETIYISTVISNL